MNKLVYVGGDGYVHAFDRNSGELVWETELKKGFFVSGSSFVSLVEAQDGIFAFSYGKMYKLDKGTGEKLFEGPEIKRLKNSVCMISVDGVSNQQALPATGDGFSNLGGGDGGDGD